MRRSFFGGRADAWSVGRERLLESVGRERLLDRTIRAPPPRREASDDPRRGRGVDALDRTIRASWRRREASDDPRRGRGVDANPLRSRYAGDFTTKDAELCGQDSRTGTPGRFAGKYAPAGEAKDLLLKGATPAYYEYDWNLNTQ